MHGCLGALVEAILVCILPKHVAEDLFGDPWRAGERRRERAAARERRRVEQRAYRERKRKRKARR